MNDLLRVDPQRGPGRDQYRQRRAITDERGDQRTNPVDHLVTPVEHEQRATEWRQMVDQRRGRVRVADRQTECQGDVGGDQFVVGRATQR